MTSPFLNSVRPCRTESVNPFPLIEFAVQLPERDERIRQSFKVGRLFGLVYPYVGPHTATLLAL
jgi:hypothetical protein